MSKPKMACAAPTLEEHKERVRKQLKNGLIPLNYNILLTRASEEETLRHDRKKGSAYDNHNLPHNPNNIYSTVATNL